MHRGTDGASLTSWVGANRVLSPAGALPQAAWRLNPDPALAPTEALVRVELLNLDAVSFSQIRSAENADPEAIGARVLQIVRDRGKMHNPATGSGGVLVGRLEQVGPAYPLPGDVSVGDAVCPMVSLSLIPLHLEGIEGVDMAGGQVAVRGHAVLFPSMPIVALPDDLPRKAALAALDVAGAPAYAEAMVRPGMRVLVIGGGKSGLLTMWAARRKLGRSGMLVALDASDAACARVASLGVADAVVQADARDALAAATAVLGATGGESVDLSLNCASAGDTEMGAILSTVDSGVVVFFSMATSFTQAALGAEGVGKFPRMVIGNGYAPGHASLALGCLRESADLVRYFSGA